MEQVYEGKENCTGCFACYSICPKQAITMEQDEKGFKYPVINKEKCIDCGMCRKICPIINKKKEPIEEQKVYAVKNKDLNTRLSSSSGGVFIEIARHIVDKNGCVFGAVYDEENNVKHIKVENIEDINLLKTSKYVQSDINNTYKEAKDELLKDRYVLFSGTPCQIAGLLKTLNNINQDKLITCDIVCHGVPSPRVFKDYKKILEKKYKSKIKSINFRHKDENETQNLLIEFQNSKKYVERSSKDTYYKLFLKNFILRGSCYSCKFCDMNRMSDITLGDFWGIGKTIKNFDDNKGVSLIILNTIKGKDTFERIQNKFEIVESNTKDCLQINLMKPQEMPIRYDDFWKDYIKRGYKYTYTKCILLLNVERVKRKLRRIVRRKNG